MEAIIFTKEQFTELITKLDVIQSQLTLKADPKKETFIDNQELLQLMKISKISQNKKNFLQLLDNTTYKTRNVCTLGHRGFTQ